MIRKSLEEQNNKISANNYDDLPIDDENPVEHAYKLNDKILCEYSDGYDYAAKIVSIKTEDGLIGYNVHYQGWSKRYDEFVSDEAAKTRFKPFTDDKAKKAADEVKEALRLEIPAKPSRSAEKSTPSTKHKQVSEKHTPKLNEVSQDEEMLSNLITQDLGYVLLAENYYISKAKKLPKMPAKVSIEEIVKKYLLSKKIRTYEIFETTITNIEEIQLHSVKLDAKIGFLLHLFNALFLCLLVYDEEKPVIDKILKSESDGHDDAPNSKRYSEVLGFTHLIRFIARIADFLDDILGSDPILIADFVDIVKDFCTFLEKNATDFYGYDQYYKIAD